MLTSTVLQLRAQNSGLLPLRAGEMARAAFLNFIGAVAPDLAQAIHDADQRKPFTLSPPAGGRWTHDGMRVIVNKSYWMRFTILDPTLYVTFSRYFAEQAEISQSIRLGEVQFLVEAQSEAAQFHAYSRFASVDELCEEDPPKEPVCLQFLTPTAFHTGGQHYTIFPEPALVFDSLLRRWNAFTNHPLAEAKPFQEWVRENVVVSQYVAYSQTWWLANHPQVGFIGQAAYQTTKPRHPWASLIPTLANFAFYAGVGKNTPIGMGMARRILGVRERFHSPWRIADNA